MRKRYMTLFILVLLVAAASLGLGSSPFKPLSEISRGQRGVGYTVLSGTKIRSFSIEVMGLVQDTSKDKTLILIRTYGAALTGVDGIAAGMSGSPVFIGGKLAGAISYTFDAADPQYGLVTPIEDMLNLWKNEDSGALALAPSPLLPSGCSTAVPVATPLLLSGTRYPHELQLLADRLGLRLVSSGGALGTGTEASPSPEPGSAVAAVFAYGDYNAAAIGTVTWVDGDRFLAFGHPLTNCGSVDFMATGAYIQGVIPSQSQPFKVGEPLDEIGRITQDRGAGACGVIGGKADTVAVEATVLDKGRGVKRTYHTSVVREPSLIKEMSLAALLDALDRTFDQYTPGTVAVKLRIEADGAPVPLVRDNTFCDRSDVAVASLSEVGEAIDLLLDNDFKDVKLKSINLEAELDPRIRTATIIGAHTNAQQVEPGDNVKVEVELRPYRAEPITVPFEINIPADTPPGIYPLEVRGGLVNPGDDQESDYFAFTSPLPASLEEDMEEFMERPKNNDLILEYLPFDYEGGADEEGKGPQPVTQVQSCDYVIDGQTELTLEVEASATPEQN